jgi:diaminohydroxyphosphoribosylaminopyrimidine deaminase/5-amino-6-(5-phosphoribosylamino)uracil reductase
VGALLVRRGEVVGKGWHRAAGLPHAEVEAILDAKGAARGADLYVTLEPCDHHGRTGPCTEAILAAGIRRVAVSVGDPNPLVSGKGIRRLREAGLEVVEGVLPAEGGRLVREWSRWISTGLPYVTLKLAMSLDGRIASASGESRWVTGERARRAVHLERGRCDAVLVGGGTLRADDPLLTVRIGGAREPLRVVVTSRPSILLESRMVREGGGGSVVAAVPGKAPSRRTSEALEEAGVRVLSFPAVGGRMEAGPLLRFLGSEGVCSLLVEGGGKVAGWLVEEGVVDRYLFFLAPKIVGEGVPGVAGLAAATMADARLLRFGTVGRMGEDLVVEAYPPSGG